MEENMENIFTGKTVDEAKEEGLKVLGITEEEAEIEVLEEGKRKLFGSVKARVKVVKKATDGERAANFIDGLMGILKIPVDCENYRAQREEKLKNMAVAKAAKAVEKKRRVALEPMSPYERRVVHSVLSSNEEVTTVSEGKEPTRRVVIIPKNEVPFERRERGYSRGGRQFNRDKREGERQRYGDKKFSRERREGDRGDRRDRGERRENDRSSRPPRSSAPRGKKQIYLGTYLGNSGAGNSKDEDKE